MFLPDKDVKRALRSIVITIAVIVLASFVVGVVVGASVFPLSVCP